MFVTSQPTINLFVVNGWSTVLLVNQPTAIVQKGKGRGKKGHGKRK